LLRAVDGLWGCVECLRTEAGETVPMGINPASSGRLAFPGLEPIGVVVAISAFNHPMNLIVHQVGPAIAAGCPVIVKPAEDTPLSCFRLVAILREAGLPDAWCQALTTTDVEVTGALVADPRVGFFSFIGSARVGWMLRSKLAPGTRCALEHGGAAPVLVEPDADIDDALPLLAKGGFYHAGQVCVSVQRLFVHRSIARQVADRLAVIAAGLQVGDPTDGSTEVGPLIRPREVDRVAEWVDEALAAGAERLCGGERLSDSCYAPTVLFNPPATVRVSTAEVFGPVVCVYPYDDMEKPSLAPTHCRSRSRPPSLPTIWTVRCAPGSDWMHRQSWSTTIPPSGSIGCRLPGCMNPALVSAVSRTPSAICRSTS